MGQKEISLHRRVGRSPLDFHPTIASSCRNSLEGVCDDSQTQLYGTTVTECRNLNKEQIFSGLTFVLSVLFSPHRFISLSDEPFSLAKVVQTGATPINKLRSGRNYHGSLPQIAYNLGIP